MKLFDEGGNRRATGGQGQHLVARFSHQHGVFPLRRERAVFGDDGPAVAHFLDFFAADVEHGLNRDRHAGLELAQRAGAAVVKNLRLFMKLLTNAVAAKFAHHTQAVAFGKALNRMAHVAQIGPGLDLDDAVPHGVIGQRAQAFGRHRAFAHNEHAAAVAVPAVLDDGHVHIDDVAFLQRLVIGNAVADLVVDGGADRFGIRVMARRRVVQRRRDGVLDVDGVVVSQFVELVGGHAGHDEGRQVVQQFRGQSSRHAHACNASGVFVSNSHGANYPIGFSRLPGPGRMGS